MQKIGMRISDIDAKLSMERAITKLERHCIFLGMMSSCTSFYRHRNHLETANFAFFPAHLHIVFYNTHAHQWTHTQHFCVLSHLAQRQYLVFKPWPSCGSSTDRHAVNDQLFNASIPFIMSFRLIHITKHQSRHKTMTQWSIWKRSC